jgi:hypothetical protein
MTRTHTHTHTHKHSDMCAYIHNYTSASPHAFPIAPKDAPEGAFNRAMRTLDTATCTTYMTQKQNLKPKDTPEGAFSCAMCTLDTATFTAHVTQSQNSAHVTQIMDMTGKSVHV